MGRQNKDDLDVLPLRSQEGSVLADRLDSAGRGFGEKFDAGHRGYPGQGIPKERSQNEAKGIIVHGGFREVPEAMAPLDPLRLWMDRGI